MVTMSELDSTAGLDGRSISTSGTLLIVQAGTPLALFIGSHGASGGIARTWDTFATEVTPAARSRALTHVEVGARDAAQPALKEAGR
jgi:hypothetical protein